MDSRLTALTVAAAALVLSATITTASPKGYVTASSDLGNGKVTAPVRTAQYGKQVRLPGGNWQYCEVSCTDTLRREVLDFWQSQLDDHESGSD